MGSVRNTMQLINSTVGKIDDKYDMTAENMYDILNASDDKINLITNSFRFGYMQGMKAAKKAMKNVSA